MKFVLRNLKKDRLVQKQKQEQEMQQKSVLQIKTNAVNLVVLGQMGQISRMSKWNNNIHPNDGGCCGGCECGCSCCGCCGAFGSCWQTCDACPPPTCGCGEVILSGETCLNSTYYTTCTGITDTYSGSILLAFKYEYVLGTSDGTDAVGYANATANWYLNYVADNFSEATTTEPSGTYDNYINASANNCFCTIAGPGGYTPFSSYDIGGCDYVYPITAFDS